jgi:hypothetical protein
MLTMGVITNSWIVFLAGRSTFRVNLQVTWSARILKREVRMAMKVDQTKNIINQMLMKSQTSKLCVGICLEIYQII